MLHYPIKEAAFLAAVEQQTGEPLDEANTALWKLIAELQNKASAPVCATAQSARAPKSARTHRRRPRTQIRR